MHTLFLATLVMLGLMAWPDTARTGTGDLAKQSQNPVSSLNSVPFEANWNFNAGPEDASDWTLQPSLSFLFPTCERWHITPSRFHLVLALPYSHNRFGDWNSPATSGKRDFAYLQKRSS